MIARPAFANLESTIIRRIVTAVACLSCALALSTPASADEWLWELLRSGGQVVLMRHSLTTPGSGDPPGMTLDDCSTQRNLSEEGRSQAREVGAAFRAHGVPVERVLSSPWCRCLETAQLAFGRAEKFEGLSNLFGRPEKSFPQVRALKTLIASYRGTGNLILVTHGSTIAALAGVSPETSEMVIVALRGDEITVMGRLVARAR